MDNRPIEMTMDEYRTLHERIKELEAGLKPFADGYRRIRAMPPIPHGLGYHKTFTMQDLAHAAELLPTS